MKLNAGKIQECAAWVETHGLHPQACGATNRDFCAAMGISESQFYEWMKIGDFGDAIAQARDKFAARTVRDVENALVKAALGLDAEVTKEEGKAVPETVREFDPATGKLIRETTTMKMVTVKAVRERRYYPPDVHAAKFVLTNLSASKWREKQDVAVSTGEQGVHISVSDQQTADALRRVIDNGGIPSDPED